MEYRYRVQIRAGCITVHVPESDAASADAAAAAGLAEWQHIFGDAAYTTVIVERVPADHAASAAE